MWLHDDREPLMQFVCGMITGGIIGMTLGTLFTSMVYARKLEELSAGIRAHANQRGMDRQN